MSMIEKDAETLPALYAVQEALDSLRSRANQAYSRYIKMMSATECLGWEAKVASGSFGEAELDAHSKANEHLGRHRGLAEAINAIETALRVLASDREALARKISHSLGKNFDDLPDEVGKGEYTKTEFLESADSLLRGTDAGGTS